MVAAIASQTAANRLIPLGNGRESDIAPAGEATPPCCAAFIILDPSNLVDVQRRRGDRGALIDVPGITDVHSVAGPFDLVAVARVKEHEALSDLVTGAVSVLDGVVRTETLIAFRQFAKSDPGLAWDVGGP